MPERLILACPRVSPEYELGALRALMKPQDRGAILYREAGQRWPVGGREIVDAMVEEVGRRLGVSSEVHWPEEGEFFFIADFDPREVEEVKGLAVAVSTKLSGVWLKLDRLYLLDGAFYRRERGFKLKLVVASNVHLTRGVRAALRGLV